MPPPRSSRAGPRSPSRRVHPVARRGRTKRRDIAERDDDGCRGIVGGLGGGVTRARRHVERAAVLAERGGGGGRVGTEAWESMSESAKESRRTARRTWRLWKRIPFRQCLAALLRQRISNSAPTFGHPSHPTASVQVSGVYWLGMCSVVPRIEEKAANESTTGLAAEVAAAHCPTTIELPTNRGSFSLDNEERLKGCPANTVDRRNVFPGGMIALVPVTSRQQGYIRYFRGRPVCTPRSKRHRVVWQSFPSMRRPAF